MSIKERVNDAQTLWSNGKKEGALIMVLTAVAATSRKRYPPDQIKEDNRAFKQFIFDELELITGGPKYGVKLPFKGRQVWIGDILYAHMRCSAVHEGTLDNISLTPPMIRNGRRCALLRLQDPLGFPKPWVEHLATVVWLAPENDDEFADDPRRPAAVLAAQNKRVTTTRMPYDGEV